MILCEHAWLCQAWLCQSWPRAFCRSDADRNKQASVELNESVDGDGGGGGGAHGTHRVHDKRHFIGLYGVSVCVINTHIGCM